MGIRGRILVRKDGRPSARGRSIHHLAPRDNLAAAADLAPHGSPGPAVSIRRNENGGVALDASDLSRLQGVIGNHAVQRLLIQRTVDVASAAPATIQRAPVTVLIDGKPYTFDDGSIGPGSVGQHGEQSEHDRPIPIFDVKRRGSDLMKLVGNRPRATEEEAPNPEAFTPKELEEMAEDEEMRRAPEMFERAAELLDTRYEAVQQTLRTLSRVATSLGLPDPTMTDLMDRERAIEKALVDRPHRVYLNRFEIGAQISRIEAEAEERMARIEEIKPLIPRFREVANSVGGGLDTIEGILEGNLKIKGRKGYLKTTENLQKSYDRLNDQGLDAIARYRNPRAVGLISKVIEGLIELDEAVQQHGEEVEDGNDATGGGVGKGSGSAKEIVMTGRYGKLTKSVYSRIDSKVLPEHKLQELLDNVTTGEGGQGVKALAGKVKGGYTYELKFLGKLGGNRIFGRMDTDGRVLFTKYGAHL